MARLNEEEKKRIETMASSFMNEPNSTWKEQIGGYILDKWEEFKDWFMHIYNNEMSKISESDRIKSTYNISYSLEEIRQKICEIDEK